MTRNEPRLAVFVCSGNICRSPMAKVEDLAVFRRTRDEIAECLANWVAQLGRAR